MSGGSTTLIPGLVTTEENVQKKNDVKARSMLLIALSNEHLMTFNQYKDAKTLFAAIQTRFSGNEAAKKTQKTLLKKMYDKFCAPSTESLDSIFNRLQKIRLKELQAQAQAQVLRIWLLCHPLAVLIKLILLMELANTQVSPASTQVSTASTKVSTANLNDLEEMDLKWQLALLSMRTRRFFQKIGKKITINGSDTAGYVKSKVECFNCHKMGHLAKECKGPRNQDIRIKNQDSSRRTINVEETSSKEMMAIDGAGFDWSYMVDDEVPTNLALMAFSDSDVHNDKTCSKTCLKSFETLKTQLDDLRIEFNKSEFNLATYKRGLSVEEKLVFYKKNEVIFWLFSPLKFDLSYSGLEEFQQPEFEGYGPKPSKSVSKYISNEVRESLDAPLVEESKTVNTARPNSNCINDVMEIRLMLLRPQHVGFGDLPNLIGHPQKEDQGYVDSGCSRHMTGNMSYLLDFKEFNGGYVTFGGGAKGGKITSKGTLKTGKLDFEDVYFVKELQFNLFSVSQMFDKKNNVLFTDTGCFVLSPDFKLANESKVLLKVPRNNNMYSVDMKNIVPKESLTCLIAKATLDESML
ncbi:ribonuclease H-like domain-containing protein [Tanacetum coccineum]|uniref:Ribonuclease H-like domain-containing protein n=1 Tax=Tanacetum coccineum TaxID=301880 RepID=A0ABQ5J612_9ASTR